MTNVIEREKPKGNHRHWHTTQKLFLLQCLKKINAIRPVDNPMTFIEFMLEVANGRITMKMQRVV